MFGQIEVATGQSSGTPVLLGSIVAVSARVFRMIEGHIIHAARRNQDRNGLKGFGEAFLASPPPG